MNSITFFLMFIPLLAIILLALNLIFAPHTPYSEKSSTFECGFHSFLGQNRTQFSISFFIFGLLFLLFDLELLVVYPLTTSFYTNGKYGLTIMLIFFLNLTLGFAFEIGKKALSIESKQYNYSLTLNSGFNTFVTIVTNSIKSYWKIFSIKRFAITVTLFCFIRTLFPLNCIVPFIPDYVLIIIGLLLVLLISVLIVHLVDKKPFEWFIQRLVTNILNRCLIIASVFFVFNLISIPLIILFHINLTEISVITSLMCAMTPSFADNLTHISSTGSIAGSTGNVAGSTGSVASNNAGSRPGSTGSVASNNAGSRPGSAGSIVGSTGSIASNNAGSRPGSSVGNSVASSRNTTASIRPRVEIPVLPGGVPTQPSIYWDMKFLGDEDVALHRWQGIRPSNYRGDKPNCDAPLMQEKSPHRRGWFEFLQYRRGLKNPGMRLDEEVFVHGEEYPANRQELKLAYDSKVLEALQYRFYAGEKLIETEKLKLEAAEDTRIKSENARTIYEKEGTISANARIISEMEGTISENARIIAEKEQELARLKEQNERLLWEREHKVKHQLDKIKDKWQKLINKK